MMSSAIRAPATSAESSWPVNVSSKTFSRARVIFIGQP
jgi:hypothetical protein